MEGPIILRGIVECTSKVQDSVLSVRMVFLLMLKSSYTLSNVTPTILTQRMFGIVSPSMIILYLYDPTLRLRQPDVEQFVEGSGLTMEFMRFSLLPLSDVRVVSHHRSLKIMLEERNLAG